MGFGNRGEPINKPINEVEPKGEADSSSDLQEPRLDETQSRLQDSTVTVASPPPRKSYNFEDLDRYYRIHCATVKQLCKPGMKTTRLSACYCCKHA